MTRDPEDVEALYRWFDALATERGPEEALHALRAFAATSTAAAPSLVLGYCLFGVGRRREAVDQFRRAHARRPREPTLYGLSSALIVTGRAEEALELLNAAGRRRPLTARPLVSLANAYLARGQPGHAARTLRRISARGRSDWKELVESAASRVKLAQARGRRAEAAPRTGRHSRSRSGRLRADWASDSGDGGVLLRIHGHPGAVQSRVGRVDPWRGALAVEVKARAKEGEANAEICAVIARALGVPPSAVMIVGGARSREKIVKVDGVAEADARRRLEGKA